MSFGDLLHQAGGMGRFQFIHVTLLAVPILMMASHNLLQNFTAATPEHHCQIHDRDNDTRRLNVTEQPGPTTELLRAFLPLDATQRPANCLRFTAAQWRFLNPNATGANATRADVEPCLDGWSYDRSEFASTIITQWDLVCDFRRFQQMAQSIYMAGVLLGGVVFGGLSDKYGRRAPLIWSYMQMAVAGSCAAFSPNFISYCIFRFLTGMALSGIILNGVCLTVEWIPTNVRTIIGTMNGYCYSVGQLILVGVAYAIRDWRWLQLAVSLPFFIFFLYSWWFAESARWQILTGKPGDAVQELRRVARINGKKEEVDKLTLEMLKCTMQREMASVKSTYSVIDLVRTPTIRRITCCISLVWFSTSFSYYGLAMDLQNFGVNIYLIQVIFGAVDIPAKFISVLVMSYFGRRVTQAGSLILGGLAILANIFVPLELQTLRTSMAVLGKGCLSASFNCTFLYTGELYPTVISKVSDDEQKEKILLQTTDIEKTKPTG
ncbi:solute carrier family 22 member 6-A-like isoform X2 [Ambystoma mexicanum]|uniref:solute carrier family 22 member 6-A-like isoform X2 n=1 Tax=Ambystoma mexicanum TaxID=8296 RepID=UPI0037E93B55